MAQVQTEDWRKQQYEILEAYHARAWLVLALIAGVVLGGACWLVVTEANTWQGLLPTNENIGQQYIDLATRAWATGTDPAQIAQVALGVDWAHHAFGACIDGLTGFQFRLDFDAACLFHTKPLNHCLCTCMLWTDPNAVCCLHRPRLV